MEKFLLTPEEVAQVLNISRTKVFANQHANLRATLRATVPDHRIRP